MMTSILMALLMNEYKGKMMDSESVLITLLDQRLSIKKTIRRS